MNGGNVLANLCFVNMFSGYVNEMPVLLTCFPDMLTKCLFCQHVIFITQLNISLFIFYIYNL